MLPRLLPEKGKYNFKRCKKMEQKKAIVRDYKVLTEKISPDNIAVMYFITVKVNADDIEGDEHFSIVQFKFREIILSELGEIGNIGFHRVYFRIIFCLFGSGAVASGEIGVEDIDRGVIQKSTTTKKLLRKDTEKEAHCK